MKAVGIGRVGYKYRCIIHFDRCEYPLSSGISDARKDRVR